jgi:hypothetical protein
MKHATIWTFLKHYLPRRIRPDMQALIRGLWDVEPYPIWSLPGPYSQLELSPMKKQLYSRSF